MVRTITTGSSLRRRLAAFSGKTPRSQPLRWLAQRAAPLTRQGQPLGTLHVLVRITLGTEGPGRGALVFEWPDAAAGHAVVSGLARWAERHGTGGSAALEVKRRPVTVEGASPGTHLNVAFAPAQIGEETDPLWEIVARVGLGDELARALARAGAAAPEPAAPPPPARSPAAAPPADPAADAVEHNAVFDPDVHPRVAINGEVTRRDGVTFRLITKRLDGERHRVWIRVGGGPGGGSGPTRRPTRTSRHLSRRA